MPDAAGIIEAFSLSTAPSLSQSFQSIEQLQKFFIGSDWSFLVTTRESEGFHFEQCRMLTDCVVMRVSKHQVLQRGFGFVTQVICGGVWMRHECKAILVFRWKSCGAEEGRLQRRFSKPGAHLAVEEMFIGGIRDNTEEHHLRVF